MTTAPPKRPHVRRKRGERPPTPSMLFHGPSARDYAARLSPEEKVMWAGLGCEVAALELELIADEMNAEQIGTSRSVL